MDHEHLGRTERTSDEGARMVAEFFGPRSAPLFGVRHIPRVACGAGVVVCSGLHGEFVRNHARETALGRSLCALGIPVQRFHYRGTGHGSDLEGLSFETMREDALTAARWLMDSEGCDRVAFVGTRWGGFVAASAATQMEAPLVLWDPALSAERYFKDLFRLARINDLREVDGSDRSLNRLADLHRLGLADILGYAIPLSLYESARVVSLDQILEGRSGSILIVVISSRGSIPAGLADFVTGAAPIDTHVIPMMEEPWWFAGGRDRKEEQELLTRLIPFTTSWLSGVLEPSEALR